MTNTFSPTLNPRQAEAVAHFGSPLLIIAGAGSGKTMVLTVKISKIVTAGLARADQILGITFTNKNIVVDRSDRVIRSWTDIFHGVGDPFFCRSGCTGSGYSGGTYGWAHPGDRGKAVDIY